MKTTLLAATALAIALAGNCPALTPVDETFNQDSLDPATWYQYTRGKGEMSPSNKKLNFVVKKNASKDDFASIELLTSQPGQFSMADLLTIARGERIDAFGA